MGGGGFTGGIHSFSIDHVCCVTMGLVTLHLLKVRNGNEIEKAGRGRMG